MKKTRVVVSVALLTVLGAVFASGASYTVAVTVLPAGFMSSTPTASPAFPWLGSGLMIGNFVLN